ncbi:MAG: hypothetical protein IJ033_02255 [Clostridia bacterium]|nr:hypothetical protein [Clostridia bacterium]
MKKTLAIVLTIVLLVGLFSLVACTKNPNEVVLQIDKKYDLSRGDKLIDYMEYLDDKDKLEFDEENGMIESINEVENSLNSYWMLYTDDPNNSNSAWGTYEYKGKTYYSATLGATALTISRDYTYIWVYQTF